MFGCGKSKTTKANMKTLMIASSVTPLGAIPPNFSLRDEKNLKSKNCQGPKKQQTLRDEKRGGNHRWRKFLVKYF